MHGPRRKNKRRRNGIRQRGDPREGRRLGGVPFAAGVCATRRPRTATAGYTPASSASPGGARPGNPPRPIAARAAPIAIRFSHPRAPPPRHPPTCAAPRHRMPPTAACQPPSILGKKPIHSRAGTLSSSLLPCSRGTRRQNPITEQEPRATLRRDEVYLDRRSIVVKQYTRCQW